MTYSEFKNSELFKRRGWFKLALQDEDDPDHPHRFATILQWEPGNQHWYAPLQLEGREEVGDLNIALEQVIVDIQPLLPFQK